MHTRQNQFIFVLIAFCLIAVTTSGCESGPRVKMAPGYETTPTRMDADVNLMGTPDPTPIPPTPTPEPLMLDDTQYTHVSKTFSLYIPQGWKLALEDNDYVRFEALDHRAWFEVAMESTGYQLAQEDFENYINATLAFLYNGVEDFEMLESHVEEGQGIYTSTFNKDGVDWVIYDIFIQRSQAIYAMSFWAYEPVWEIYRPGFKAIVDGLETRTGLVTEKMIYTQRRTYTSPNNQFVLEEVPLGWTFNLGQNSIEGAIVDVIESPDRQAAVQIVAYSNNENLDIGLVSIPIIKELNGDDVRFHDSMPIDDGRVRTELEINKENIRGFSFFWQDQSIVYILTFRYSDEQIGAYQTMSYIIGDSFAFANEE